MRLPFVRVAWLACLSLLAACATPPRTAGTEPPTLLLISIDALRADYLGKGDTPNLDRIAAEGVRAEWMNPSYPSLTFPNHYTLVTGLRPDRHGIVHNSMADAALGDFRVSDERSTRDARWWNGGEPLWVAAEKQHVPTAVWAWPGSHSDVRGARPSRHHGYDEKMPLDQRFDAVSGWLLATHSPPRFVAMYLEPVDKNGHDHGPDSPQTRAALRAVDAGIGRLRETLRRAGRLDRINLVVVSDHGMATVAADHVVAIEDMVPVAEAKVVSVGQVIGIDPNPGFEAQAERRLLGEHGQYDCWRKGELPARWHYGTHPRVPAIVCQMHEGWDALPRAQAAKRRAGATRGSHGYDPALPSMRAIFIANGPSFRRGVVLPGFDNVDVYPLLAKLSGVTPAPNDGNPKTLLPALKSP